MHIAHFSIIENRIYVLPHKLRHQTTDTHNVTFAKFCSRLDDTYSLRRRYEHDLDELLDA